jgi:hypothetical protein
MHRARVGKLIEQGYHRAFGASVHPAFAAYFDRAARAATLGYRLAGEEPLGLEAYLDAPIELVVADAMGKQVTRDAIVEIGNFVADNAFAMIELWGAAANDLGGSSEVVVATLTAPLRQTFARIGVPIVELADADPKRIGAGVEWGRYYEHDPKVCAGLIAEGQRALNAFARRRARIAA